MSEEIKEFAPVVEETPTFDPAKKYTWANNAEFKINGAEFGMLLNALRSITSTKEAQIIIMADKAADVVEGLLAKNVETGVVVEVEETNNGSL